VILAYNTKRATSDRRRARVFRLCSPAPPLPALHSRAMKATMAHAVFSVKS